MIDCLKTGIERVRNRKASKNFTWTLLHKARSVSADLETTSLTTEVPTIRTKLCPPESQELDPSDTKT